jgi:hypothetical protein
MLETDRNPRDRSVRPVRRFQSLMDSGGQFRAQSPKSRRANDFYSN